MAMASLSATSPWPWTRSLPPCHGLSLRLRDISGELVAELFDVPLATPLNDVLRTAAGGDAAGLRRGRLLLEGRVLAKDATLGQVVGEELPEWLEMQFVLCHRRRSFEPLHVDAADAAVLMGAAADHIAVKYRVAGRSGVGKTSLIRRFVEDAWSDWCPSSIGVDFKIKKLLVDDSERVKMQIWDAPHGKERIRTLSTASLYRGAHAILVCFDLTDRESFEALPQCLDEARGCSPDDVVLVLVGTKEDDHVRRQIREDEANALALAEQMPYFETSAKMQNGVDELFYEVTDLVLDVLAAKSRLAPKVNESPVAPWFVTSARKVCDTCVVA